MLQIMEQSFSINIVLECSFCILMCIYCKKNVPLYVVSPCDGKVAEVCKDIFLSYNIMKKSTFWSDASHCGAVIGLVNIAIAALSMLMPKMGFVFSLVNLAATIYLLFEYTRRRAILAGAEGYTYGQSLGFMVATGIFTGIVAGAYQIVAANWLFTAQFEAAYEQTLAAIAQVGVAGVDMDQMTELYRTMLFSPLPVLASGIFGSVISHGFYGLFVAIATKREPDLFDAQGDDDDDEE